MLIRARSSGCGFGCPTSHVARVQALFLARSGWLRFFGLVTLGGLAGLGQAPTDVWPATLVALAVLLALILETRAPRQAAFYVWVFGFGYFGFSLRWIIEPFLVDIARHGWMAPFAIVLMAAGGGLFWAIAVAVAKRFVPGSMLCVGLALVTAEVTRSLILTGFPWALLGHVWVTTPLAQLAAYGGPHLLSLITVLAAWGLVRVAHRHYFAGAVTCAALALCAFLVRPGAPAPVLAEQPIVRLVQPNAPQHQKWDPAFRDQFVRRMVTLTGEGDVPDLIVWPETAVPYLLNNIEDDMRILSDAARGAPLVFGIQRFGEARAFHNSLVVMGPGGEVQTIYDKRHLVPFGEYIPGARLLGQAGATGLARNLGTGFTPGQTPGPIRLPGIGGAIPLICYEGIFAEEVSDGGDRARLLLLITNDAWFGEAVGPFQHLAQARLRAIEQGLPMVRVANTGISAMIDPKGRIVESLPLNEAGALDVALPAALAPTPYVAFGDWPIFAVLFLLLSGLYVSCARKSD